MPESQEVGKSELAHNPTLALRDRESAHNAKLVSPQNVSFSHPPTPPRHILLYLLRPPPLFFFAVVAKLKSFVLREDMAINDSLLM